MILASSISILLALTWWILIKKGGLLQEVSQWINSTIKIYKIRTLLQCPYCISGQFALIGSIIQIMFNGNELCVLWSVPISINVTYILFHNLYE